LETQKGGGNKRVLALLAGIVYPKMKTLSLFTHSHGLPKPALFLPQDTNRKMTVLIFF